VIYTSMMSSSRRWSER